MERIPPKDRFNHHADSGSTPPELLHEALRRFGLNPEKCELRKLSGGFMNANFVARGEGRPIVLRVYATDMRTAQKEFDLLRFLEFHPVSSPKVFDRFEVQGRPVVVMEYLDGVTLEEKLSSGETFDPRLYEDIGRELGRVHNIRFARAGFIGPGMKLSMEFDNFSRFLGQFIDRTLKDLESRPDKLSLESNARFRRLFEDKWDLVIRTEIAPQLAHCDFNPKNILISRDRDPKVLGIIDWEFSDSGNGLIDLGNFFRFFYDYPDEARGRFVAGYRSVNDGLSAEWEEAARLIDLGNMCGFLERREDYQKSFRTARAVITSTLAHFGY